MRRRRVTAADGREWEVSSRIEWSTPSIGDDFEHDVDGGAGGVILVVSSLVLFWVLLFGWLPTGVHLPWWLWVFFAVGIGFFPARWVLRRPYTLVAETLWDNDEIPTDDDLPPERWTGLVRGRGAASEEFRAIVRSLHQRATPGHANSPLQPLI